VKVPVHQIPFPEFLSEAKKQTYASLSGKVLSALSGAKEHEFIQGDYRYVDIYFGSLHFSGIEIVYVKDKPLWAMSYSGGVVRHECKVENIYAFLRQALLLPEPSIPVRGPKHLAVGEYTYGLSIDGTLEDFSGSEIIRESSEIVYSLHFAGGNIS
jgi:hypothetical protein